MNISIILLSIIGLVADMLSSSIGFGGDTLLLPIVTSVYSIEVVISICTIAQLLNNVSCAVIGRKSIEQRKTLWFSLPSIPLMALGAYGFFVASKNTMTIIAGFVLTLFTIQKLRGKLHLPQHPAIMVVDGYVTGFINGMLSISGSPSSAVFLTLDLSPVSYIANEATAAMAIHVVRIVVYDKLNLINEHIIIVGLSIAATTIIGSYLAMRFIKNVDRKRYRKVVAGCVIPLSLFLIISVMR